MSRLNPWTGAGCEPDLGDLLADPVAAALMAADRVTVAEVIALVGRLRLSLGRADSATRAACEDRV
jgi:hypothetical protein